jgi:hypothetical protein
MTAEDIAVITLIKKSSPNPIISKRIFLDEQGKVCSDGSQCLMAQGTATRATAETAAELAQHIMACGTDQAIALGALKVDPAWALIDFDTKDMPPNVAAGIEAAGGMWSDLLTVAQGLLEQNIEVRTVPVAITETKERSAREGAVR